MSKLVDESLNFQRPTKRILSIVTFYIIQHIVARKSLVHSCVHVSKYSNADKVELLLLQVSQVHKFIHESDTLRR